MPILKTNLILYCCFMNSHISFLKDYFKNLTKKGPFACSPRVCVGSLQVLWLPHTIQKGSLVTLKLSLGVNVWGCVSFVSVWPCDGLATCPGCNPPLAQ